MVIVVFAALAVTHWIENATGWSIKKFVRTARRYRTVQIRASDQTITAADPLPDDLRHALDQIHDPSRARRQHGETAGPVSLASDQVVVWHKSGRR